MADDRICIKNVAISRYLSLGTAPGTTGTVTYSYGCSTNYDKFVMAKKSYNRLLDSLVGLQVALQPTRYSTYLSAPTTYSSSMKQSNSLSSSEKFWIVDTKYGDGMYMLQSANYYFLRCDTGATALCYQSDWFDNSNRWYFDVVSESENTFCLRNKKYSNYLKAAGGSSPTLT